MTQPTIKTQLAADASLTMILAIPSEELEQLERTHAAMLAAIREALAERRRIEERRAAIEARVIEAKAEYDRQALAVVRWRRRGASMKAIQKALGVNAYMTREQLKHGRALARARLADAKKAEIIRLHCNGLGPRPIARLVAARFGNCSPAYAAKIVKGWKQAMQPELPLRLLRAIK